MRAYFRFVLARPGWVILACLVLTILSGISVSRMTIASSLVELFLGDDPDYQLYAERSETFGNDEILIVAFPEPELATAETLEKLRRVGTRIETFPEVEAVQSIVSVIPESVAKPAETVAKLVDNPLIRDLLISGDSAHTAVIVQFRGSGQMDLARAPEIRDRVVAVFVDAGWQREDLHLGGMMAALAEIQSQAIAHLLQLTPLVGFLLLLATYILFRRLWPVFLTGIVGFLSIIWTMGFALAIDPGLNLLVAIAPSLIVLIAFSDVVHLCSAYIQEIAAGKEQDAAILDCASEVGTACIFTSLTTFVGFIGLTLLEVPAFRTLGIVCGFGVGVALLLAMTLVPIILSRLRPPTRAETEGVGHSGVLLDRILGGLQRIALARPVVTILVSVVITAALIQGAQQISIETDFIERMSADNRLRHDVAYLDEHFAGNTVLELFVQLPAGAALLDADIVPGLQTFTKEIADIPGVGKVVSIADAIAAARSQGLTFSASASAAEMRRFYDPGAALLRLPIFLHATGMYRVYEIGEEIVARGEELLGSEYRVEPSGLSYISGKWLEKHIASQWRALLASFSVIALTLIFLFRSITVGLWSMIPNVIPLIALGGVLGWFWGSVDSDLVILAVIAIGIAVDDTIHFLSRCRVEAKKGKPIDEVLRCGFTFAGRAILITSLIFAVGFVPFATSDYLPIWMIGLLFPFVMVVALLADLLLLPALIAVGIIRLPRPAAGEGPTEGS